MPKSVAKRNTIGAAAAFQQELLGLDLRLGVERLRVEGGVLRHGRAVRGAAVVAVGGGEDHAFDARLLSLFEDGAGRIDVEATRNRLAHRLARRKADDRGQVHHELALAAPRLEQRRDRPGLADVGPDEAEAGMVPVAQQRLAAEEQRVDDRHPAAPLQQQAGEQRAHVASATGDQHVARRSGRPAVERRRHVGAPPESLSYRQAWLEAELRAAKSWRAKCQMKRGFWIR
jgi:hypothetical protein